MSATNMPPLAHKAPGVTHDLDPLAGLGSGGTTRSPAGESGRPLSATARAEDLGTIARPSKLRAMACITARPPARPMRSRAAGVHAGCITCPCPEMGAGGAGGYTRFGRPQLCLF